MTITMPATAEALGAAARGWMQEQLDGWIVYRSGRTVTLRHVVCGWKIPFYGPTQLMGGLVWEATQHQCQAAKS